MDMWAQDVLARMCQAIGHKWGYLSYDEAKTQQYGICVRCGLPAPAGESVATDRSAAGSYRHFLPGHGVAGPPLPVAQQGEVPPEPARAAGFRRFWASRPRFRHPRRAGLALMIFGGLLLAAAGWILVTALMARSQLAAAGSDVRRLRAEISAGNVTAAQATAADLAKKANRAHGFTTGPIWAMAAALPAVGEPLRTIRGVTASIDSVGSSALPRLVNAAQLLDPAKLRGPDGRIDLAAFTSVTPELGHASTITTSALREVRALPDNTWLSPIDSARTDVLTQLGALNRTIRSALLSARILPPMLGRDGPKRYFVAFQNEAESRGTGGLPGAFGIAEARNGVVRFTRFESDTAISSASAKVDLGLDYDRLYGHARAMRYGDANRSPNFPYAAKIWAAMWQQKSGQRVDGVIAVDPTALSYLLAVTGPASMPDHTRIAAYNVVALTQQTVYARFATNETVRREFLLDAARTISKKILDTEGDTTELVRAAGNAVGERRLVVWSADPKVQADVAQTSAAGIVPITPAPYVGLSVVNKGGTKLDYYLDRSLTWQRTGCGTLRQTTVTITLTNNAPATGLSTYVTARRDKHSRSVKAGDNRLRVSYFATSGAVLRDVSIDANPAAVATGTERGHPVYSLDVELPRGASRTVVLHLAEPAGSGQPTVLRQPLVIPLRVSLAEDRC
jgi:Protein of unknown function (DUF4012)